MRTRLITLATLLALAVLPASAKDKDLAILPDDTFLYAVKGADSLYLDIYRPLIKTEEAKPTILFMFGGGFKEGDRVSGATPWIKSLVERGYPVVSIDYRLGLKDYKGASLNLRFIKALDRAIGLAVEDLYSATLFLLQIGDWAGVDAGNMVVCGSSAGAISVIQGEYEICNSTLRSTVLPEDFNYAGVMTLAGAIYSHRNPISFDKEPCPIAMFHGTSDSIVVYNKIAFMNLCFGGSNEISKRLTKQGIPHRIYRFKDHNHEVAIYQDYCLDKELDFLEKDVIKGMRSSIDELIDDPDAPNPHWNFSDFKDLY